MLYEVITGTEGTIVVGIDQVDGADESATTGQPIPRGKMIRITSYNVCYTKLLRPATPSGVAADDVGQTGTTAKNHNPGCRRIQPIDLALEICKNRGDGRREIGGILKHN